MADGTAACWLGRQSAASNPARPLGSGAAAMAACIKLPSRQQAHRSTRFKYSYMLSSMLHRSNAGRA